jgi:NAD(P)-dependent dehydrogenase (short-subunit alcohol dehydrogenase family)
MGLPSFSLEGKVAIVTGGSKGIGREIALAFAEAGADVVVCSRALDGQLEAVAGEIRKLGRRSLAIPTDITQKVSIDNMVKRTLDEFSVIDILVNNAGILVVTPFLEHSEEIWDLVMDTNLKGSLLCSQAVVRKMIDQKKGNIINMSSIRGLRAGRDRVAYCVSKAGVIMMTQVMALELAPYHIRVNAIAPGWIKTQLNERLWRDPGNRKKIEATVPLGHLAEPDTIAGAALFLASDVSSYITGHTLAVDGGFTI